MSEYKTIPVFSRYRINTETEEVQSNAFGKGWKKIKPHRNGLVRIISDDKGTEYAGSPTRILYAAQRGINPAKMGRHLVVVKQKDGELVLLDRKALAERNIKQRTPKSVESAKEEYAKAIDFCRCVLRAYETEDYTEVVTHIWKKHDEAVAYIKANKMSLTEEGVNEMWMQVFDIVLTNIRNKGSFVCNVSAYIRKVIRTLYAQKLRVNKLLRSYDDGQTRLSRII
jgi:hypothetical protein